MDQAFAATKRVAEDHEALEMARLDQEILALQYDDDDGGGQHDPSFATNSELEHLQKVRHVYIGRACVCEDKLNCACIRKLTRVATSMLYPLPLVCGHPLHSPPHLLASPDISSLQQISQHTAAQSSMESALRLMRKELVLACKTGHADAAKATHEKWKQHADKVDATCAALRAEIKQHAEEARARHDRQTADLERAHHEAVADLSKLTIQAHRLSYWILCNPNLRLLP